MEENLMIQKSVPLLQSGKKDVSDAGIFSRSRYKFWILSVVLLLAFWSMFTGTVTLKWSTGNLSILSGNFNTANHDDIDVLEVEERKNLVRQMWNVYTHSRHIQLPVFWQKAFAASYDQMVSEDLEMSDAAVLEIAKMSMRVVELKPPTTEEDEGSGDDNDGSNEDGNDNKKPKSDIQKV
ncbi:hypothetical protein ZOSMA_86G00430 [Zostera marina]|uniref:Uncharacterized protein n=1 Tax=Zostera marina TaxID=29655 RepID=A0A0K9NLB7_ZOSMR|nr:hypothetical protein ZOSMA_86G00430 [Zostera marina]